VAKSLRAILRSCIADLTLGHQTHLGRTSQYAAQLLDRFFLVSAEDLTALAAIANARLLFWTIYSPVAAGPSSR